MPNVPLSTRFVGFAPETNLQERKSANINALSQPYTMQDIASTVAGASTPTFEYSIEGGTLNNIQIDYGIGSGEVRNQETGLNTIQTYYVPFISGMSRFEASSITFYSDMLAGINWEYENNPEQAPVVPVINFPNLTKLINLYGIGSGSIDLRNVSSTTTISAPLLTKGYIELYYCDNFTTLNIPSLTNDGSVYIYQCNSLSFSGISFDSQFSNFNFSNCDGLGATISIPATEIKTSFNYCPNITTLSFPNALTYGSAIYIHNCSSLENITLGSVGTLKSIYYDPNEGADVYLAECALSSASVTNILDILISLDGTNGTTEWGAGSTLDISGGTSAVPSAGDLVKIATLEARGATINYNS